MKKTMMSVGLFFLAVCGYMICFGQEDGEEICTPISGLSVGATYENAVLLQWYSSEDASGWDAVMDSVGKTPPDCAVRFFTISNEQMFSNLIPYEMYNFYVRSNCGADTSTWTNLILRFVNTGTGRSLPLQTSFADTESCRQAGFMYSTDSNTYSYMYIDFAVADTAVSSYLDFVYRPRTQEGENGVKLYLLNQDTRFGVDFLPEEASRIGESEYRGVYGEWTREHIELPLEDIGATKRLLIAWENRNGEEQEIPTIVDSVYIAARFCPVPYNLQAREISSTSALISWTTDYLEERFEIEYRKSGDTVWENWTNVENNYLLYDLVPDTYYEVRVKSLCDNEQSFYSSVFTFKTLLDLPIPSNIRYFTDDSSAEFTWDLVSSANKYKVSWKKNDGISAWEEYTVYGETFRKDSLESDTRYCFKILSAHDDLEGVFSDSVIVKTLCVQNEIYPYLAGTGPYISTAEDSYNIAQCWTDEGNSLQTHRLSLGALSSCEFSFEYKCPGVLRLEISVDEGAHFDLLEFLPSASDFQRKVCSLSPYLSYDNVIVRWKQADTSTNNTTAPITIRNLVVKQSCPLPENISAREVEENSFVAEWDSIASVSTWLVRLKDLSGNVIEEVTSTQSRHLFGNLEAGTLYNVVLYSYCEGVASVDSVAFQVGTLSAEQGCIVPQDFVASWIHSDNGETLYATWQQEEGVNIWQVVYKDYYAVAWDSAIVTINPIFTLRNMELNRTFLIKVRSVCNVGDSSDFTETQSVQIGQSELEEVQSVQESVEIYPNPTDGVVNIEAKGAKIERIVVYGYQGKEILRLSGETRSVDLSGYGKGVYLVVLYAEGTKTVKKVIVQ